MMLFIPGEKLNPEHIMAWRACRIVLYGIHKIQYSFKQAWSQDPVFRIPAVCDIMTQDMFVCVNKFLHFEDLSNANLTDISWKYRQAVQLLKRTSQAHYQMPQDCSIDEGVRVTPRRR
eukprot:1390795-Pyramimonas_sp.AAC.1